MSRQYFKKSKVVVKPTTQSCLRNDTSVHCSFSHDLQVLIITIVTHLVKYNFKFDYCNPFKLIALAHQSVLELM